MNVRLELTKVRLGIVLSPYPYGTRELFMRWDRTRRAWANLKMTKKKVPIIPEDIGSWDGVDTYTWKVPTGTLKRAYYVCKCTKTNNRRKVKK